MNTINHSYNGINGSGNNDSSRSGSGSGSGSSISYIDGNHVPSSSSSSQHNQDRSHGPSSKFIVKDTILSPSTSGTTRDFKTCNATRGTDHRVDRSSLSSLSLSNNDTGLDQQQQHHHINDRSGNYSRTSQNNNNSSSSSNNSSVLDVSPDIMINPPANSIGQGGTSINTNYKMSVNRNNAWVSHNEESTAADGKKTYSYEIRILEKINGHWKLVGQSIHIYKPK